MCTARLGPKCDSVIDHVNPWRVLVFDRTLQSIAYKLVPHLYKGGLRLFDTRTNSDASAFLEEIERQIAYYKERDLPYPASLVGEFGLRAMFVCDAFVCSEKLQEKRDEEEQHTIPSNSDLHIYDDQVAICIETRTKDLQVASLHLLVTGLDKRGMR